MNLRASLMLAGLILAGLPAGVRCQVSGRSFDLGTLQQAAIDTDPRSRELQLFMQQTDLRLRNIGAQRLPTLTIDGQAQYQSDVAHLATSLPGVSALFLPPKDTFDSGIRLDQRLFDTTISVQSALERAQLAENQARVRSTLFALRQQVNDAFFAAATLQARAGALAATIEDLNGRLREMNARVQQGTALAADAAAVEATLLERQQDLDDLQASRRGALDRLATLTGQRLADTDMLVLPDFVAAVAQARQSQSTLRARPGYRVRADARTTRPTAGTDRGTGASEAVDLRTRRVRKAGTQLCAIGVRGVCPRRSPLAVERMDVGIGDREREALAIQQQVVAADKRRLPEASRPRSTATKRAIDRVQRALAIDERIVTLREQVDRATQLRFRRV